MLFHGGGRPAALSLLIFMTGVVAQQNFSIDINKVTPSDRARWCSAELTTCATLCANNPKANDCDPSTLKFSCQCQNNSAPGLEFYTQSLPTFICEEAFKECNEANVGNANGQTNCTNTIKKKCGTLDPSKADLGGGSSTTGGQSGTPTTAPSTSSSRAAAPTNFQAYGNGAAVAAFGLFAYLL